MPFRPAVPLLLLALLAGCASEPAAPPTADAPAPAAYEPPSAQLHALSGSLLGAPAGTEVELALLEVDARNRPERLLSSLRLRSQGDKLPFMLQFNPERFIEGRRVELRGRVTRQGQLIMKLPALSVTSAQSQSLGILQLVPAP